MAHSYGNQERSADAVLHGSKRENKYIPYQDSPYYAEEYNKRSGPGYGDGREHDDNDVFFTQERLRRRRYGGLAPSHSLGTAQRDRHEDVEQRPSGGSQRGRQGYEDTQLEQRRSRRRRSYSSSRSRSRGRSRSRSRSSSTSSSRSSSRGRHRGRSLSRYRGYRKPSVPPQEDPYKPSERYTLSKAAKAAAMAGAVETLRCRREPGSWSGQKGKRIALAAGVGVVIGALRNGSLLNAGQKPYAEAAMSGFYGLDFLKRVLRHTEFGADAEKEQRDWRERAAERERHEEGRYDMRDEYDDRRGRRSRSSRH